MEESLQQHIYKTYLRNVLFVKDLLFVCNSCILILFQLLLLVY